MPRKLDDLCPRPEPAAPRVTEPTTPAIYPAAVYRCRDPEQAEAILRGELSGHIYRRESHPNADQLAQLCAALHGAEAALITASGMAAIAAAALSELSAADHVVLSRRLYGRSEQLLSDEFGRFGVESTSVDLGKLDHVRDAIRSNTRLILVETISNPTLRVADLQALANLAHRHGARLLVDNTFAGPVTCRPLTLGADLVVESLTKIINGHGDVLLGMLCGSREAIDRARLVAVRWGFSPSPFDCWLAVRGMGTLALRMDRAAHNARKVAQRLASRDEVVEVLYPGLPSHPDRPIAERQFGCCGGFMVSFTLSGGVKSAKAFIAGAREISFSPSLGELTTMLSHPASTSHFAMPRPDREALGIHDGTIRLSVGIESAEFVVDAVCQGLDAVRDALA